MSDDDRVVQDFHVTVVKPPNSGLTTPHDMVEMLTTGDLHFDDQCEVMVVVQKPADSGPERRPDGWLIGEPNPVYGWHRGYTGAGDPATRLGCMLLIGQLRKRIAELSELHDTLP